MVLQSDLLSALPTRLVVPLARSAVAGSGLPNRLAPEFEVDGGAPGAEPHLGGAENFPSLIHETDHAFVFGIWGESGGREFVGNGDRRALAGTEGARI